MDCCRQRKWLPRLVGEYHVHAQRTGSETLPATLPSVVDSHTDEAIGAKACAICGSPDGHRVHTAREMMFGLREPFDYLECAHCGCVQLLDVPEDFAKYYPPAYYSFAPEGGLKAALNRHRALRAHGTFSVTGWAAEQLMGPYQAMEAIRDAAIPRDATVLDVGCGAGYLIRDMYDLGYRHVTGIDPFLAADVQHANGVTVRRCTVAETDGTFDVVMLHHAFEHMPAPADTLRDLAHLLAPGGRLLIRIPVAGSYAWRRFGVNWVNLDAPRHLYLHTVESMQLLAAGAQLSVSRLTFDGNPSQFIASEQYARDIPLADRRSVYSGSWRRWIGWWQARRLRARVAELNAAGQGDWACFELRSASTNI